MNELTTFTFKDPTSSDEVCVIVRHSDDAVALAISSMNNGDVECVMNKEALIKLIDALNDARSRI